jgi:hypothetical protein
VVKHRHVVQAQGVEHADDVAGQGRVVHGRGVGDAPWLRRSIVSTSWSAARRIAT